jgi:serine/threonine-protein kinase
MGDSALEGQRASGFKTAVAVGLPLPRTLGRRVLLKLAARGGMGDVYLAATTGIEGAERPCIVKTVRRDHIHDGSFLARFLDEARVQAQLQHPGVAQVLEAATDEQGEPYTVVEYVEGRSLSDVRQRAVQTGIRLTWPDAVAVAIEIAQALAHVHERCGGDGTALGIVHRDLSPQNVMVGYAGEIKLIDFGTARGQNRRCHTVAGVVFAKPGYVAPEVARQQVGDGRIDIYALGIVLWELCAGRRFLTGDPQQHLDDAAAGRVAVPPLARLCGAPDELDAIVEKLTKNDPDERYPRASLAATDLARLLSTAPADGGERGVRARIAQLMRKLWPHEPARSRAEFVRLLREARDALGEGAAPSTPRAGPTSQSVAAGMAPADPAILPGTPYRLGRKLGEGAHGVVHEAEHVELGRKVALKVLSAESAGAPASFELFRREARAVAGLSHPNLVQLYDFGRSLDGRAFLAMELCAGETLDAHLRRGPLPWREAVAVAIETTYALEAAHAAGLVHRDIKPQNLMLGPGGGVKLLDFGIATALTKGQGSGEPRSGSAERALRGFAVHGTPEYMAPEQVAGDPVDRRTDLYALGCVLYEMLTGVRAFDGPSSVVVMGKQLRETPAPPRQRATAPGAIPRGVEAVVLRAMAKRPEDRFASAAAMCAALDRTLRGPALRRERVRHASTAVLSAAAMLAAAAGAAHWQAAGARASALRDAVDVPREPSALSEPAASPTSLPAVALSSPAAAVAPPPVPLWDSARAGEHAAERLTSTHGHGADVRKKAAPGGGPARARLGAHGDSNDVEGADRTDARTDLVRAGKIAVTP